MGQATINGVPARRVCMTAEECARWWLDTFGSAARIVTFATEQVAARFIVVDKEIAESGAVEPFGYAQQGSFPRSEIATVTPSEFELVKSGDIPLPLGWIDEGAMLFERDKAPVPFRVTVPDTITFLGKEWMRGHGDQDNMYFCGKYHIVLVDLMRGEFNALLCDDSLEPNFCSGIGMGKVAALLRLNEAIVRVKEFATEML